MKYRYFLLAFFMIFYLLSTDCTKDFSMTPTIGITQQLTTFEKQLVESDNVFGIRLFQEISKEEKNKDIFISPLSIAMALSMAYNGSAGSTEEAMRTTLNFGILSKEEINQSFKNLIVLLSQLDPKVQLLIANSIWYRQDFSIENQFIDLNRTYFNAEVRALDFRTPDAVEIINSWVNDKTNSKIKEIIDQIDESIVLFLINAIYFKSDWTYEFKKSLTEDGDFISNDSTQHPCKMMTQSGNFAYLETSDFQAVELPYGNKYFRMSVFLPIQSITIDSLIAIWDPTDWQIWQSQFRSSFGTLYLPKFKLEYSTSLVKALQLLGMGIAFDPNHANFTYINSHENLFIDNVLHKSYINVDEEGTEAAAVTAIGFGTTSIGPSGFVMRVNRPFLFVIWESQSNTILLLQRKFFLRRR